ncbi:hypothetical protein JTB14_018358 [Gonioctena quinquepunctata]|nr:hypothetical protein JTB14_018358 [Gonioctena quinquepunctata]
MNSLIFALVATLAVATAAPSGWGLGWGGHGALLGAAGLARSCLIGPQAGPSAVVGPVQGLHRRTKCRTAAVVGPVNHGAAVVGPVNHGAVITPAIAAPAVLAAPAVALGHGALGLGAGVWGGHGGWAGHGGWGGHW